MGLVKFLLVVLQVHLRREKQMVNETFTMMMNNKRIVTIIIVVFIIIILEMLFAFKSIEQPWFASLLTTSHYLKKEM